MQAPSPKDQGDGCFSEDSRPEVLNDDGDDDETRELDNTEDVLRAQMANLILENNKLKSENEKLSLEKTVGKEATYEFCLEKVKDDHKCSNFIQASVTILHLKHCTNILGQLYTT